MKNFRLDKILVPMDFSKQSFNALDTAIAIAQQQRGDLTLIHVINGNTVAVPSEGEEALVATSEVSRLATEDLNVLTKSLSSKYEMEISYIVKTGVPATSICCYAKENGFNLIIIGTKGVFGFRRRFTKTTAYRVVKASPCPVLSVPAVRLFTRFRKVVYPIRNAPRMLDKYEVVRSILSTNDSSLLITGLTKVNDSEGFKVISVTMDALKEKLHYDHVKHSSSIHFCNSISSSLLDISDHEKPDLIVIMARIDDSLKRFFLEYFAKNIISSANCAVLSIRPDMSIVN
jgi:nucleotide-binding universal stress UspA family protein